MGQAVRVKVLRGHYCFCTACINYHLNLFAIKCASMLALLAPLVPGDFAASRAMAQTTQCRFCCLPLCFWTTIHQVPKFSTLETFFVTPCIGLTPPISISSFL